MELANQSIVFEVEGLVTNTLVVTNLSGREGLSELWEFELELVSRDTALDAEQVLYAPIRLGFKQGILVGGEKALRTRWFDGVLSEFRQREQGQGWTHYTARMVPKLWLTTQFWRSRILLDQNVEGLTKAVLGNGAGLSDGEDFSISLHRAGPVAKEADVYPEREYIVQYEETDFAFLSRWLEHEGVFYFFDNEGEGEQLVVSDSTAAYRDAHAELPYHPSSAAGSDKGGENTLFDEDEVRSFALVAERLPKQVVLKDYNWRTPEVELSVGEQVKGDGIGLQTEYNDHYKTEGQGKALAGVRKEELTCRAKRFTAVTNCKALRPGKTFQLKEHYRADFNSSYLVIGITHEAEQAVDLDGGTVSSGSYSNTLQLIPADVEFRPERLTDWPAIHGIMYAKVDAPETDGEFAEIDDYGRYRVRFPFDEAIDKNNDNKRESGPASRYVRMAQPYAGRDSGMHFPLLKGTEVLISHVDGDPDRPVIVGAVPNPDTMSPVTSANYMKNRIVTTSGNTTEFDDNPDRPGVYSFNSSRSVVEDNRYTFKNKGNGGGGSPSGGGGGVRSRSGPASRPEAPAQPEAHGGTRPRRAPAPEPAAGSGAAPAPTPTPTPPPTAWEEYTADGKAFKDMNGDVAALKKKIKQVLRKHDAISNKGNTPKNIFDLIGPMFSEPFAIPPSSADVDEFLKHIDEDGSSSYSASPTKLTVKLGDNVMIKLGTAAYTFDDVSNSVSIGTGGYSYKLTDGDSVSETFYEGAACSTSRYYGAKDSWDLHVGASNATLWKLSASESQTMALGASNSAELSLSAKSEFKLTGGIKQSTGFWIGLSSDIDMYVAGKFKLELGAAASLTIKLVADKLKLELPKKTEITAKDVKVMLDNTNAKLKTTTAAMAMNHVALNKQQAALKKLENQLSSTKNTLSQKSNELSSSENQLSSTKNSLSKNSKSLGNSGAHLSHNVKALIAHFNSGATMIN